MNKQFSEDETQVIGGNPVFPAAQGLFADYGLPPMDAEPIFNRPISTKENFKLALDGKVPCWAPFGGFWFCDSLIFAPRQLIDNYANHLVLDGCGEMVYPSLTLPGLFDLEWEYVPVAGGATVHPGDPKVPDMANWEKYITMPSADDIDWDAIGAGNKEYLSSDRLNTLHMLNGPWERLMSLMNVDYAALALIDDDQKPGIHRFLDQYCTYFDQILEHITKVCDLDSVMMHDDWGHQNGPFFSHDTAEELLFPYLKRIVASCHDHGLYYEQHSCGRNETFIDLYVKAGVNLYCPQAINDFDVILEKAKGSQLVIGVPSPMLPMDASEEMVQQAAEEWFSQSKGYHVAVGTMTPHPGFNAAVYRLTREEYAKEFALI